MLIVLCKVIYVQSLQGKLIFLNSSVEITEKKTVAVYITLPVSSINIKEQDRLMCRINILFEAVVEHSFHYYLSEMVANDDLLNDDGGPVTVEGKADVH